MTLSHTVNISIERANKGQRGFIVLTHVWVYFRSGLVVFTYFTRCIWSSVINFLVGHIWISMSHPGSSRVLSRLLCVSACLRVCKMESLGLSGRRYLSGWRLLAPYLNPCDGQAPLWKSDGITFSSFRSHFFGWCAHRQPHVLCEWWAREGKDVMTMR